MDFETALRRYIDEPRAEHRLRLFKTMAGAVSLGFTLGDETVDFVVSKNTLEEVPQHDTV